MRFTPRLLVPIVLLLSIGGAQAAADPIIITFTSPAALQTAYPEYVIVGLEEFNDSTLDGNVAVSPTGSFVYGGDALPEGYETTGATTYSLVSAATAQLCVISYFPEGGTPPVPFVRFLSESGWINVGPLLGVDEDPSDNSTSHFWAFYSSDPFSAVEVNPGVNQKFSADVVAFAQVPVPEPSSTLVLLTTGLLATAGFPRRRRR
jgi:hypothetical protein